MKSNLSRQLQLRAYLLAVTTPTEPVPFGKQTTWLSRSYLCEIAAGGRVYEPVDFILVDILLDGWDRAEKLWTS